jgi:hypothetical protein
MIRGELTVLASLVPSKSGTTTLDIREQGYTPQKVTFIPVEQVEPQEYEG